MTQVIEHESRGPSSNPTPKIQEFSIEILESNIEVMIKAIFITLY
jgi:hypothetical protein